MLESRSVTLLCYFLINRTELGKISPVKKQTKQDSFSNAHAESSEGTCSGNQLTKHRHTPRCLCSQLQGPRKPMTAMWMWAGVLLVLSRGHRACSTRKSPCSCVTGKQKEQTSKTSRLTPETSSQHTCYAVRSHHPRGRKKTKNYYFPLLDQTYRF